MSDELDCLHERRKLIAATDQFAHLLGQAILAGAESPPQPASNESYAERPGVFLAVDNPVDIPVVPARDAGLARRLEFQRRQEFADELRGRLASAARTQPALGRFTIIDLEPGSCRYATSEDGFFCGAPATRGSYCAEHGARCFRRAP